MSANASALVFLAAIVSMVIGSGLSVILHPILGDWSFLLLPLSLLSAGLLTSLDRIFWTIQRFHDLGKSWVWALGPPIGVVAALAIAVATPFVLGEPVTIIISAIVLLLIAAPIGAMYVHWLYKPGMAGDNRYGPEPSPIQDTWREL